MFGNYEEKDGRWTKKINIWKIIAVIGIIGLGLCVFISYARGVEPIGIHAASLQMYKNTVSGGMAGRKSTCKETGEGVYRCGLKETYEKASHVTHWYAQQKTIKAVVTAYSSEESPGINAKGYQPIRGFSIACPRSISFGSRIRFVEGGIARVCDDRTALRYNGRFDLYVRTRREAIQWGKKTLEVTIYESVNND